MLLEPGIADRLWAPSRGEVPDRGETFGGAGPERAAGDTVAITLAAGPACELGAISRVGEQAALGVGGQAQYAHSLVAVQEVQDPAFEAGRLGQICLGTRWHRPAAERLAVGLPTGDGRMQLTFRGRRAVASAQADLGQ